MSIISLNESDLRSIIENVIEKTKTYSGKQVAKHIINITPDRSDVPDYFINKFILPNKFTRKIVNINELLQSDPDFKAYYESGEERYDQDEEDPNDLDLEIVVFNGELLDGYSRASQLLRSGDDEAYAFVNVTSNVAD